MICQNIRQPSSYRVVSITRDFKVRIMQSGEDKGYSAAWLHHKGRNKHHYEYWIDYSLKPRRCMAGMKMPMKYFNEMIMDRIAASKVYEGRKYTQHSPLAYYEQGKGAYLIHEETRELLEYMLRILDQKGEEATFRYMKKYMIGKKQYPKIKRHRKKGGLYDHPGED